MLFIYENEHLDSYNVLFPIDILMWKKTVNTKFIKEFRLAKYYKYGMSLFKTFLYPFNLPI